MIQEFYEAFKELDAEKMVSKYHPKIEFEDPAFGVLKGERAKNMWRMLISSQKGKRFEITYSKINENKSTATANWEAKYIFSKTGKEVHNKISAKFEFEDGLIIKHTDEFNLALWARQALGLKGIILGNTKFFKRSLNLKTNTLLDKFESNRTKED